RYCTTARSPKPASRRHRVYGCWRFNFAIRKCRTARSSRICCWTNQRSSHGRRAPSAGGVLSERLSSGGASEGTPSEGARRSRLTCRLDRLDEFCRDFLRVAVHHARIVEIKEVILDSRKAGALAALDHEHVLRLVRVQDRHAVD